MTRRSMTAYLGGASPVLQVRDSRLRWGGDTDSSGVVSGRRYVERVLVRYRYRAYPTPGQTQLLARAFGCARVVFNDALRARQDTYAAGEKISDTQVQRRVVTLAKTTPARQWLGGVASVALVQACQDARRGYRNWFDSLSGARKGRKVGHPRFRSRKDNRAWIRLTRNGFGITTGGVRVAKVGDVRLVWSRVLPCRRARAVIREPAAGTTRRLWSRWQTPRYPRAPTMSGSTSASRAWPCCPLARSSRTLPTCAGRRGRWPVRRSHWQGRRRDRSGAPRRYARLLSSIARSAIPAWTPITSWPTASPAITKGSTRRTWPCPAWPGPGWRSRWPMPAGRHWRGCWQEKALRCHRAVGRVSRWVHSSRVCS